MESSQPGINPINLTKDVMRNLEPSLHAQDEACADEKVGETRQGITEGRRLPDTGGSSSLTSMDRDDALEVAGDGIFT